MNHDERAHSRLAPSAAPRWMNCPGSAKLAEQYPEDEAGEAAEFGTLCHEALEMVLRRGTEWAGTLDAEVHEMAGPAMAYIIQRKAELGPRCVMYVEQRENLSWIHPELFGTPDVVLEVPDEYVEVIDLKTGRNYVPADTPQLRIYALNFWNRTKATEFATTVIQPLSSPVVRSAGWSRDDLAQFAEAVAKASRSTQINPGQWCQYCPATGCSKRAEAIMSEVKRFEPTDPAAISNDDLGKALALEKQVTAWFKAARKEALRRAHDGMPPTGWKLVQGRQGNRRWTDELTAATVARAAGVEFYESKGKSPAALEKEVGKAAFAELFAEHIDRPPGSPTLAPASDDRAAITSAEAEFDE